jgi:hypothetical protein
MVVGCTQRPPTQHEPACPEQSELSQQGLPGVPQATTLPLEQTIPLVPAPSPDATQVPLVQHPPPPHMLFGQHGWPAPPHAAQVPLVHMPPFWQVAPEATHWRAA